MAVFLTTVAAIWLFFYFRITKRTARRNQEHRETLSAAGVAPGTGFDHHEGDTGIAINRSARTLTLSADGARKSYHYDQVRSWEVREERGGHVVPMGGGLAGAVMAGGSSARMAREAEQNTGLFISVKDLDHAKWRIEMRDSDIRARWMELLRQEINEGGASA